MNQPLYIPTKRSVYPIMTLWLFTFLSFFTYPNLLSAQCNCTTNNTLAKWDFNDIGSASLGSSGIVPSQPSPNPSNVTNLASLGGIDGFAIPHNNPSDFGLRTQGWSESSASSQGIKFTLNLGDKCGQLSTISFKERRGQIECLVAPCPNQAPQNFVLVVKKNGSPFFTSTAETTTVYGTDWTTHTINLTGADFSFNGEVVSYEFDLKAYNISDPSAEGLVNGYWDIDDLELSGCCKALCAPADQVSSAGTICCDQTILKNATPAKINSTAPATGGNDAAALEYIWLKSTNCNLGITLWIKIDGATSESYQPPALSETTCFVRCARRAGCVNYVESNSVMITVLPCPVTPPSGGKICCNQSKCNPYDPDPILNEIAASGPVNQDIEYMWVYVNCSNPSSVLGFVKDAQGNIVTTESYDPPAITQTTCIRRCARYKGCSSLTEIGESNTITLEVKAPPTAALIVPMMSCQYDLFQVTGESNANASAIYTWNFGPDGIVSFPFPADKGTFWIRYNVPGTKTITFTVTDGTCSTTTSKDILIKANVTYATAGSLSYNNKTVCVGETPPLVVGQPATVPGDPTAAVEYQWFETTTGSFVALTGETGVNFQPPTSSTAGERCFNRCARRAGCEHYEGEVWVCIKYVPKPTISIDAPDTECVYDLFKITGTSNASATATYTWTLDGAIVSGPFPTDKGLFYVHYNTSGSKTITFSVTDNGCSNTATKVITITPNVTLQSAGEVSYYDKKVCVGDTPPLIESTVAASVPSDPTAIIEYQWFDTTTGTFEAIDGATSASYQPPAQTTPGKRCYNRCARRKGCDHYEGEIKICIDFCPKGSVTITAPTELCIEGKAQFGVSDAGTGATYTWNFGDCANPATFVGQTPPLISYICSGTKNITVTVKQSDCACTIIKTATLVVFDNLNGTTAGVIAESQKGCGPFDPVLITGTDPQNGGRPVEYIWLKWNCVGEPTIANAIPGATSNTYDPPTVDATTCFRRCARLTGCVNYRGESNNVTMTVCPNPKAEIIVPSTPTCPSAPISVSAADAGTGAVYTWDFGPDATASGLAGKGVITVQYNVCGDKTIYLTVTNGQCVSKTQAIIKVSDTEAPIFSKVSPSVTVDCQNVPACSSPIVTDNCSKNVMVTLTETPTPGACPNSYTITRVWKATDACGNTATASQVVMVADGKAPVLKAPVDVTVECGVILSSKPKVTDNCDAAAVCVALPSETISETACKKVVKRKWEATDACGNKGTTCQTVTYMDTTPPKFTVSCINVMANCDKIPAPIVMTATDNCSTATVTLNTVNTPGKCLDSYTITHTWTATDACGNSTTKQQVITVVDNNKPTLTGIDVTNKIINIECGAIAPKPNVVATDKCDTQVDISFFETPISGGTCAGNKIIRTWTATDNCSNTCSVTQCVQFKDTTPPTFINPPANATADCTNVPVAPVLTASNATDNCGQVVNVKLLSDARLTGNCKNNYKQVRKWEASDACGNKTIHVQTITVTDTKAPVISGVPADLTLECTGVIPPVPAAGVVTATDDCTPVAVLSFKATQTTVPGTCKKTIFRTWTATDVCGNKTTKTQTIWVGSGGNSSLGLVVNPTTDDEIEAADEATITVATPNVVLNSNVKENNDIRIFPNPTQGMVQIVSGMKKVQAFRLYNELGQAILESSDLNERDFSLELSNLNVGIYWLQLQLEGEQDNVVKRVVLMK